MEYRLQELRKKLFTTDLVSIAKELDGIIADYREYGAEYYSITFVDPTVVVETKGMDSHQATRYMVENQRIHVAEIPDEYSSKAIYHDMENRFDVKIAEIDDNLLKMFLGCYRVEYYTTETEHHNDYAIYYINDMRNIQKEKDEPRTTAIR